MKLLKHPSFESQNKVYCCEIINNYLEYPFSKGLNSEELNICNCVIEDKASSEELKSEALMCILLTA